MALLEVNHLTIGVSSRAGVMALVHDLSFAIAKGEVLGLAGESGAGKSLTGLALLGLLDPPVRRISGEVLFNGERIDSMTEDEYRRLRGRKIAAVFQDSLSSLNPLMTVEQQLTETMLTHLAISKREAKDRALQLLTETGIPAPRERLKSYPHQLSGGMRQRIVLALAFCCEPELIVADEPTTALDVSVQAQVVDLFMRMRDERGTSVLLISHDMGVIAEAAGRVAIMYAGHIVEVGPAAAILSTPRHPYTQGLIGAIPRVGARPARLVQIPGAMPAPGRQPSGCAFHPRCPSAVARCVSEQPDFFTEGERRAACWLVESGYLVQDVHESV